MTSRIGSAFDRNADGAGVEGALARLAGVEARQHETFAPAARQVRTRASIDTGSLSWKSRNTRSVGKLSLCTSCSQVCAVSTRSKS